ncbi:MAG: Fe-S cluster assembly protein SufD, partial [Chloroflexota bacterium]
DEPGWLRQQRLAAWAEFERAPAPRYTRGIKGWWATDLTSLRLEHLRSFAPANPSLQGPRLGALGDRLAGRAVFRNSDTAALLLGETAARQGVVLSDLTSAVREHPDLVRRYLGSLVSPSEGKFAALALALWSNGVLLYVPAGVTVDLPVQLKIGLESPALALAWRTLVVLESGASVTLVEETASPRRAGGSLFAGATEIHLGEGARLIYAVTERWDHGVSSLTSKRARLERDANLRWFSAHLGAELTRNLAETTLAGTGASLESLGMFFAAERQHIDLSARTVHEAPHTTANILLNGAVKDAAHAAFAGTIRVERSARGAASYLGSHTLTLSDEARVDAVPSLEIEQNDVRVSHGSTAGKLDEEQVFYLMTRGLSRRQATRTLVRGFFEPVLSRLPLKALRECVERDLERKFGDDRP